MTSHFIVKFEKSSMSLFPDTFLKAFMKFSDDDLDFLICLIVHSSHKAKRWMLNFKIFFFLKFVYLFLRLGEGAESERESQAGSHLAQSLTWGLIP